MPISAYSTTAGSNTSVAGINISEGCPAANVNNGMRAQMADTRSFYEAATWTDLGHTPTRTGATTFTINSDVTSFYTAGRRIRCTDSSTLYGTIASSSYGAPNTTVTVTLDSGSLSVSLTAVAVSVIDPTGDPIGVAAITGLSDETADNLFRVTGSSDATKKLAFEVDGITTATTRTFTVTDTSLSIPASAAGPSSLILAEDTDNGSNTVQIIAPAAVTSNRVLTLPDATGTVITSGNIANLATGTANSTTFLRGDGTWSAVSPTIFIVQDEKSSGTAAGTATSGSWLTRNLNTTVINNISGASLASNQITLPAGTYEVDASAPTFFTGAARIALYNITDATYTAYGESLGSPIASGTSTEGATPVLLTTRFTIAATKVFELRQRVAVTRSTDGLGHSASFGVNEVYSVVKIIKVA